MSEQKRIGLCIFIATVITLVASYISVWWILHVLPDGILKFIGIVIATIGSGVFWLINYCWFMDQMDPWKRFDGRR